MNLADIFTETQDIFESDKPEFLKLLESTIDLCEIVPFSFSNHFYASTGRPREYSLTSLLWVLIIQRIFSIPSYSEIIRYYNTLSGNTAVPNCFAAEAFQGAFLPKPGAHLFRVTGMPPRCIICKHAKLCKSSQICIILNLQMCAGDSYMEFISKLSNDSNIHSSYAFSYHGPYCQWDVPDCHVLSGIVTVTMVPLSLPGLTAFSTMGCSVNGGRRNQVCGDKHHAPRIRAAVKLPAKRFPILYALLCGTQPKHINGKTKSG